MHKNQINTIYWIISWVFRTALTVMHGVSKISELGAESAMIYTLCIRLRKIHFILPFATHYVFVKRFVTLCLQVIAYKLKDIIIRKGGFFRYKKWTDFISVKNSWILKKENFYKKLSILFFFLQRRKCVCPQNHSDTLFTHLTYL